MKYRDFLKVLTANGFVEIRQESRHHQFEGYVDGKRRMVTAAYSQPGEDIKPRNLASMIRQSGLPKKLFD
ncbi:MAG: addiction module toxin, HicA family [Nitrospira sp. SB0677_bin_15]|nr:addiction module toxin, HicA family [Nitrospira sp. SB0661_bin_20]MYG40592.1 addiction module toxin, HicA family [Nitrospira sp. SB0677_bin_15]MYH02217.1 addiction module toxin, HicA family [Nitrospira sp. SB0675_bin_23]